MKKLKLSQANFAGTEVLSRAQLKKVMGGSGSGGGTGSGDGIYGTPGGNNGDPCNAENLGILGSLKHRNANGSVGTGNCNTLPSNQQAGCHNYVENEATGSYWC